MWWNVEKVELAAVRVGVEWGIGKPREEQGKFAGRGKARRRTLNTDKRAAGPGILYSIYTVYLK